MTTKVMLYLFLVERVRIVRGHRKPRRKDRLYIFNFFGLLIPYVAVIVLNPRRNVLHWHQNDSSHPACRLRRSRQFLLSVVVLQWMTSGDGPTVPAFYPLVTPNDQPHDVSQASSCSRNTCNGQKLSDLGRILDHPDPNEQASNGNRQAAVVSRGAWRKQI
ncbi:hypothetical protein EG328_009712 [Venturia inaequalis]|uniref:Uncharacterized protein n=1 Tax=Venturia inaequalis TaxID=5025 RepID=A0A8H3VKL5_VENIN|nr:hypothetical protein EG328_009712 [Venturia inaequalis]